MHPSFRRQENSDEDDDDESVTMTMEIDRTAVPRSAHVDDPIHFRLLNRSGVYSSSSLRLPRHDDDLGMDSPLVSRHDDELQYIDVQDTYSDDDDEDSDFGMEDIMDDLAYREYATPPRHYHAMYTDDGEEFASISFPQRTGHPDLIVEEDEEITSEDDSDDGIEEVIQSRRRYSLAEPFAPDSPNSPSPTPLERPQHAHLSPRSAAALTSMLMAAPLSAWDPIANSSSITPDLIALSRTTHHEYDNNPYFRRPSIHQQQQYATPRRLSDSSTRYAPLVRQNSVHGVHGRPLTHTGSSLGSLFRSRAPSMQPGTLRGTPFQSRNSLSYSSCGEEVIPTTNVETVGDVWPLKFELCYADGGEFNASHSVDNVLRNDASVYCSRRPTNINICLKLAEPSQTCVLTQFKAKAPTTGFTAPCKDGLIFISHEPIPLEKTTFFDNMTRERYEEYIEIINQGSSFDQMLQRLGANADALVPAAFFTLGGPDESCTLDFSPNRSGCYVLIKLLRSRCTNSLMRPENIDLQYLGLIGFTGSRSFSSGGLL
ncbi:Heteroproteinous nuclear ribonucleoprotein U-like protein 1 [Gryganskiella cystojenkinii]|nr:Heteroproteinous nuclear ribonucleoprotein U-like protein 1 [Gryganskiella cystojenkinii]